MQNVSGKNFISPHLRRLTKHTFFRLQSTQIVNNSFATSYNLLIDNIGRSLMFGLEYIEMDLLCILLMYFL
jgi:hypothetical protein